MDEAGRHLGGMIYPGPQTMLDSLSRDTELRVPAGLGAPGEGRGSGLAPGRTTAECIGHGVLAAQLGALNQFLRRVSAGMREPPRIVITGGAARDILPLLDFEVTHDPWLVFRGMLVG